MRVIFLIIYKIFFKRFFYFLFTNSIIFSNVKKYGGVKTFDVASSKNSANESNNKISNKFIKKSNGPFSDFVLFLKASEKEHPVSTIERNAALNKYTIRY